MKKIKNLVFHVLPIFSLLCFSTCAEEESKALCDSQFYYEGSPFRQGDSQIISPSYTSGEDVSGEFSSAPGLVILDKQKGTVDLGASVPGVYTVRKAMIGNATCANRITLGVIAILPPPSIFNLAESITGWGATGAMYLDAEDKKEGNSSLKARVAPGLVLLQHNLSTPIDAKVSIGVGELRFWLYISDPSVFDPAADLGQFELTSSGEPDKEELTWLIRADRYGFKAGWNEIVLKFKDASSTGGAINLAAIKFFRMYMFTREGAGSVDVGVDDMKIMAGI